MDFSDFIGGAEAPPSHRKATRGDAPGWYGADLRSFTWWWVWLGSLALRLGRRRREA